MNVNTTRPGAVVVNQEIAITRPTLSRTLLEEVMESNRNRTESFSDYYDSSERRCYEIPCPDGQYCNPEQYCMPNPTSPTPTTPCVKISYQVTSRRVVTAQQTNAPVPTRLIQLFGHDDLNIFAENLILASQFIVSALSFTVVVIHISMLKCKCSAKQKRGLRILCTWLMLAVAVTEGFLFDCGELLAKWIDGDFNSTEWLDITLSAKAVFSTLTLTIMASHNACKQTNWVCCRLIGLFVEYVCLGLTVFTLCVTVIPADIVPPQYLTAVLAVPVVIYFFVVSCVCCCCLPRVRERRNQGRHTSSVPHNDQRMYQAYSNPIPPTDYVPYHGQRTYQEYSGMNAPDNFASYEGPGGYQETRSKRPQRPSHNNLRIYQVWKENCLRHEQLSAVSYLQLYDIDDDNYTQWLRSSQSEAPD